MNGTVDWLGTSHTGTGTTAIAAGGVLNIPEQMVMGDSSTLQIMSGGTANWTASSPIFFQGTATIQNAGTFNAQTDVQMISNGSSANPAFVNSGTFRKTAGPGIRDHDPGRVPEHRHGGGEQRSAVLPGRSRPARFGAGATVAAGAGTVEFYGLQADGASTIASGARVELRDDPGAGARSGASTLTVNGTVDGSGPATRGPARPRSPRAACSTSRSRW